MFPRFILTSVEIPPINCLMYELIYTKAYIPPIYINFDMVPELKLTEKIINKIKEINSCIINSEKRHFSQDLKNQLVDLFIKESIAKGVKKQNSLIIT